MVIGHGATTHEHYGDPRFQQQKQRKRCWCSLETHWSNDRSWWNHKNHTKGGAAIDGRTITLTSIIGKFINICTMRQKKPSMEDASKDFGKEKN